MAKQRLATPGERLARRLEELGLSQIALSERLGVSASALSRWLSGERKPTLEMAFLLQREIGFAAEEWLESSTDVAADAAKAG